MREKEVAMELGWRFAGRWFSLRAMLRWSIPLFRIRGIPLSLHASFLLLLAYAGWAGWSENAAHHWEGLFWNVVLLLCFFTCVVLHELGHCLTALRFGIGTRRILLLPIGGMADMEEIPRQPSREILMTIAGPAVNFVIAGGLWLLLRLVGGPAQNEWTAYLMELGDMLVSWNLMMGVFNLLPAFPMDGGRILRALLAIRLPYVRATWWAATIGKVLATVGAIVAVVVFDNGLVAGLFAFIFWAGSMEYRLVQRREIEAEHWRQTFIRLHGPPPLPASAEPPPVA